MLHSAWVKIFSGLYDFPDINAILVVTPSAYASRMDTPAVKHTTHGIYAALPLKRYLRSVYFRKQVYFLLFSASSVRFF